MTAIRPDGPFDVRMRLFALAGPSRRSPVFAASFRVLDFATNVARRRGFSLAKIIYDTRSGKRHDVRFGSAA